MQDNTPQVVIDEPTPVMAKLTQGKRFVFFKGSLNVSEKYFYVGIGLSGVIKRFREALKLIFQRKWKRTRWIKVDLSLMGGIMDIQWLILFLNKQLQLKANIPDRPMDKINDPIHSLDGR